ncbi:unnamed protein product [Closterium sp. NIES-54]
MALLAHPFFRGDPPPHLPPPTPLLLLLTSLVLRMSGLLLLLVGSAAATRARVVRMVAVAARVVVGAAVEVVEVAEVVAVVGVVAGVGAMVAAVVAAVGVAVVAAVGVVAVGVELFRGEVLVMTRSKQQQRQSETPYPQQLREWFAQRGASGGSVSCPYVIRTGNHAGQTCGKPHIQHRCFSCLDDAWRAKFGDEAERPHWAELLTSRVYIFALNNDAIHAAMYALSISAEGDCYLYVPPDPGIEAAALGASESALPSAVPVEALQTFTLDSGLHLPSFSTNMVSTAALEDAMVTTTTPGGQRVSICTCTRTGRHLATFTRRPGLSLYTLATEPPQVVASAQVSASGEVAASCSCRLLSHQTLLWHHRLGHPSLPCLRGMHSHLLVYGLPRSLPPLLPSPAPPCLPCVEGRQRAAPHSSSFPLQTLHMDSWGPARVNGQGRERYFLLVVDDYTWYTTVFPFRSKGEVSVVLIPWIRTVRLQLRKQFGQDLPIVRLHSDRGGEFSSNFLRDFCRGEGILMEVTRTSMIHAAAPHFLWPFAVRYAVHQLNLWPRVSLPETSPTLRWTGKVGDASVFRVWGSRPFVHDTSTDKLSARAIPSVFLGFVPDTLGWQFYHPTSRRVLPSHDVTFNECCSRYCVWGCCVWGCSAGGAGPGGAGSDGAGSVGAEPEGVEPGGAESEGAEPGGAESEGAESGGAEPWGAVSSGGPAGASQRLSLQQLREWLLEVPVVTTGAGDPTVPGAAGAGGDGAGVAGVGGPGAGGAGAARVGAVDPGAGGAGGKMRPHLYFVPLLQQVLRIPSSTGLPPPFLCRPPDQSQPPLQTASSLLVPSPYTEQPGGLTGRRELASRPVSPVRTARRAPRLHPPPVPGTHTMALHPSSVPQRVPLPAPPESSLPKVPFPKSIRARAASPTVARLLATAVTDPSFEAAAASALVAELLDFAVACRLDYATALVADSVPASPPSVRGECALGTDVLEDRQEEFECLAAAVPRFASLLLAPEGDPDAPDIPTPRSYVETIEGPYSSQWQAAMDAEMVSWKSTGTYVDEVPPSGAKIVDGKWIFRVKRPPGSPPALKARYVARGYSQQQGVDYFHTFSHTPKMTTLWVLLHVATQRDYELHSMDFSTTFLQGSLHEEILLRRPPGFTGTFPAGTQWSLRRPVYGLRQAPCEWHNTLRTTLAALGFAPSTADPSLILHTDTSLPLFYVLVYVNDLVFAMADTEALTLVKSELQKRHTCTDLGELRSYLGLQITQDRARRTITLTQSHMVYQVLQRFGFQYSSPQLTPLSTSHLPSAPPSDEHRKVHWDAAKRVLRYLCSTLGMGLVLGGHGPVVLVGHADASWVDDSATQRSSQGYTLSLGSGLVSWWSTLSSSVLRSTCEAEIYAGAMADQELRWLTYLLTDLGEQLRSPPVLYVDNKAMIALCQEHRLEHRTKHIALRYFLARELQ